MYMHRIIQSILFQYNACGKVLYNILIFYFLKYFNLDYAYIVFTVEPSEIVNRNQKKHPPLDSLPTC